MPLPPNVLAELQRDMARLGFVVSQIREIEEARQKRWGQEPETGLTGAPDESGAKRREQGLARPAPGENRGPAMPGSAAA
jgi:transposase